MHQNHPSRCQRTKLMHRNGAHARVDNRHALFYPASACSGCAVEVIPVLDPKLFDDLSRRISDSLPRGMQSLQDDLQRNLRSALEGTLSRMRLVTREEFEVQQAVLQRTREKLKVLEARVAALEQTANADE